MTKTTYNGHVIKFEELQLQLQELLELFKKHCGGGGQKTVAPEVDPIPPWSWNLAKMAIPKAVTRLDKNAPIPTVEEANEILRENYLRKTMPQAPYLNPKLDPCFDSIICSRCHPVRRPLTGYEREQLEMLRLVGGMMAITVAGGAIALVGGPAIITAAGSAISSGAGGVLAAGAPLWAATRLLLK